MAAKNSKPAGGPDDEELLEAITGREPPEDSYAADRSSRHRGATQTGVLQNIGGTRRGPARAGAQGPPSYDSVGFIDFIFHQVNHWLDRFLEQIRSGEGPSQQPPSFSTTDTVSRSHAESLLPSAAPPEQTLVTRQTSLVNLPLPAGLVYEPDLKRYYEQMRLYDYQTTRGGLAGLNAREVANFLLRGKWGDQFQVRFNDLTIKGPWSREQAYERFMGMLPVYKAQANSFPSDRALQKAIEDDIASYLRTGQGSVAFHPFLYQ